jgi:hypothetical protein
VAKEPSAAQRKLFAKMGYAMPDGSYYIRPLPLGEGDLENAIKAVGRGEQGGTSGALIRQHIMKRAATLKLSSKIPDTWKADGSLSEAAQDGMTLTDFFGHHGVKGMHWGVRKPSDEVATATTRRTGLKGTAQAAARKSAKVAYNHPYATASAVVIGTGVYQHREEWKATGVVLARIGKYAYKQYMDKDSPAHETLAIGRQVVQGYVVHSDDELDAFVLEHHGIMGMRWGVRDAESKDKEGSGGGSAKPSKHDKLIQAAENHEAVAAGHANAAEHYAKEYDEVQKTGLNSAAGRRVYGKDASTLSPGMFYARNGQTKGTAIDQLSNNLRLINNQHGRAANRHSAKAVKLRNKASNLEHNGLVFDPNFDVDGYLKYFDIEPCMEEKEYLRHFGVKGMHWGVRKERGEPSEDHVRVSELRTKVKTGRGVHVLSNNELQDVNTRLNLEGNYARLTEGGNSSAGEKFVDGLVGVGGSVAKQQASSYANKYAAKGIDHLITKAAKAAANK